MPLGEFDLIRQFFTRRPTRAVLGVGDDCALLSPTPGYQWAVSTDLLVEGRHFLSTVPPQRLGHKSLAVNLSDLAACGANPVAFTLSLSLPRVDEPWLQGFSKGLLALADRSGIELVGGDTTAGPLTIGITVMGEVPPGQALLRSGARAGDRLWVSGSLGDARLALEVFRGTVALPAAAFERVRLRMEQPEARVSLGQALRGIASSAIDVSDGFVGDLGHVLAASGVGAQVDWTRMPCSADLLTQPASVRRVCALSGGDDYELLFTAPPGSDLAVQRAASTAGVQVTPVGVIVPTPGLTVHDAEGRPLDLGAHAGFDHFAPP
jgi:thiamine-monophosphate kinase